MTGGVGQSGEQGWPHRVCGKSHERGNCLYKCKECGKPHKEDDCFILHPEKRPKGWRTPPGKGNSKGRGRDRSKEQERGRSRSKSGERKGEKSRGRFPSPYPRAKADRVVEESEDEVKTEEKELEKALEHVEKLNERIQRKKGSGTGMKRVRTGLFKDNRREEEFMELQRQWSRGESSRGSSERENRDVSRRCRRIRTGDVPPSGRTPGSSSLEASQQEGRTMNSTITVDTGRLSEGLSVAM